LNKGGQGIYALDITNPAGFTEAGAANIVLWEFTDTNDADLGYTFSQPSIVRLNSRWREIRIGHKPQR
jgi:type IV pilus assembly protein PilY1